MIKLSVNVNKIATLRNARGNNIPNLDHVTQSIINFGADGITIPVSYTHLTLPTSDLV